MCRIRLDERIGSFPLILGAKQLLSVIISLAEERTRLTIKAGKMLKKATSPFGVVAGTRSIAAERMITYRTADQLDPWESSLAVPLFSRPKMAKAIKSRYRAF
jgi:hypothetical protein